MCECTRVLEWMRECSKLLVRKHAEWVQEDHRRFCNQAANGALHARAALPNSRPHSCALRAISLPLMLAKETKLSDRPTGTVCIIPVFLSATYFNSICSLRIQLQDDTVLNFRTNSTIALLQPFSFSISSASRQYTVSPRHGTGQLGRNRSCNLRIVRAEAL